VREYAYDRQSKVGKLDKALDEATAKGWAVVDMKSDWKKISPSSRDPVCRKAGRGLPAQYPYENLNS
jgi:hypothetical protein